MASTLFSTTTAHKGRRRRESGPRMQGVVNVCLTIQERELLRAAAATSGLPLSAWLRSLGLMEARRLGIG